ncbi:MAG: hypothetical protein DSM106950_33295 [Stigonema ocellatum SAG 48.90 = DSM 106950]|nr:hypothetical protein [Stigonema ocellatum SAG 48.90 = DSM 106950]
MKFVSPLLTLLIALFPVVALAQSESSWKQKNLPFQSQGTISPNHPLLLSQGTTPKAHVTSTDGTGSFYVTGLQPNTSYKIRIYELLNYGELPTVVTIKTPTKPGEIAKNISDNCGQYEVGKLSESAYNVIVQINLESDNTQVITFTKAGVLSKEQNGGTPIPSCSN